MSDTMQLQSWPPRDGNDIVLKVTWGVDGHRGCPMPGSGCAGRAIATAARRDFSTTAALRSR